MLTVCYINRQPGRGYHYSETNACGESAASNNITRSDTSLNSPYMVGFNMIISLVTPLVHTVYAK